MDQNAASNELIHLCLEAYFRLLRGMAGRERIADIKDRCIAAGLLRYLWNREDQWTAFVLRDAEAAHWLAYLSIPEGLFHLMLEWIKVDTPEKVVASSDGREHFLWRGILLRSLIKAHFSHATDSADEPMKIFFGVLDSVRETWQAHRSSNPVVPGKVKVLPVQWLNVSSSPSAMEISKALSQGGYPRTDPRLYNRFVGYMAKYAPKSTESQREMAIVRLHLRHPTKPQANTAIGFLRKHFDNKTRDEGLAFLPPHRSGREMFRITFREASRVARNTGMQAEAAWLDQKREDLFPPGFGPPKSRA
ncbi:hypothetical protein LTR17_025525 [Elasticomyces elasticus]|nr:hypothetical protein LTR17_025525 [Elasticomyces elasticus]